MSWWWCWSPKVAEHCWILTEFLYVVWMEELPWHQVYSFPVAIVTNYHICSSLNNIVYYLPVCRLKAVRGGEGVFYGEGVSYWTEVSARLGSSPGTLVESSSLQLLEAAHFLVYGLFLHPQSQWNCISAFLLQTHHPLSFILLPPPTFKDTCGYTDNPG